MRSLPGRILAWLAARLRGAQYLLGDLIFALGRGVRLLWRGGGSAAASAGRLLRGAGSAIARSWAGLSVIARRRLVALLVIAAAVALFATLAVPNLPCQFPAGDSCPPDDEAARIVPADALAYVHANLDPETEQQEELRQVLAPLPLFTEQVVTRAIGLLPGPQGSAPDFRREIAPWFGGEVAIAFIGGPGASDQVGLLEVDDAEGATRYARSLAVGTATTEKHRGIRLSADERGIATAQVEGFLVIGSRSGARAIIDTATDVEGTTPLADDSIAEEVRDELPDHRFIDAWVSESGAEALVGASTGTLGTLAPLISPGTTGGAAAALAAGDGSLELAVRSELDPQREKASPGFFAAFPSFEPELAERLSEDALAYLGIGEPGKTVRALLGQAAAAAPGILSGFEALVETLRREGDVDIEAEVLPSLGDEAAIAIEPRGGSAEARPGSGLPYLEFVAKGVDEERARRALARLQGPLAAAVDPESSLQAPVFGDEDIGGVEVRSLRVSPTVELAYAVFDELAVVATDPAGIAQVAEGDGGLDRSDEYERATEGFEDEVSLLAFLDLRQLIAEGFEIGLAQVPAFNTFAGELRSLEALGLAVQTDDNLLSTDLRLLVDEPLTSRAND